MIKKLYHGSIQEFKTIDFKKCNGFNDFSIGFYTTGIREHALRLATRNKIREEERLKKILNINTFINTYLYVYEYDDSYNSGLNIKIFDSADLEWTKFVLYNRSVEYNNHGYDIVIGPTADDNTRLVLENYKEGIYGKVGSEKALNRLLEEFETSNLPRQICFCNLNSLKGLILKDVIVNANNRR